MQAKKQGRKPVRKEAKKAPDKVAEVPIQPKQRIGKKGMLIVVATFVVVVIIFTSLFFGISTTGNTTDFSTFQKNFNSAKNVAIYINDTNSVAFPYQVSCATALIEELSGPTLAHRNSSTINLFVLYNNSCIYKPGGLGSAITNYTNTTRQICLNYGKTMPSITLDYSNANGTVITTSSLRFIGDLKFLQQCGIAYQIT